METPSWVLLAVALISAAGAWLYNRHRPKVDVMAATNAGLKVLADEIQEERDQLRAQVEDLRQEREEWREERHQLRLEQVEWERRRRAQEVAFSTLTDRVDKAEKVAAEARTVAEASSRQNAVLVEYILQTAKGVVAGEVPPWLPVPVEIKDALTDDDLPPWTGPER